MAMGLRHPRHCASNIRPSAPLIGLGSQCLGAHGLLVSTLLVGLLVVDALHTRCLVLAQSFDQRP
jgi:hypothetical protein